MSGTVVDISLVVLIVVFAVNGYRQGFFVGLLSLLGFFGGALVGLRVGPWLAERFERDSLRVSVALAVVFVLAVVGQALTGLLGNRLRRALHSKTAQRADDVGGMIVSVATVLVVIWLVAVPLGSSSLPWLAKGVRNSTVLGTINEVIPQRAEALSDALRETVDTRGFPDVFGDLSPTNVTDVDPPDAELANAAIITEVEDSIVKVRGTATSCSRSIEGSGFVYAEDRVMTNAHVVAGTKSVTIEVSGTKHEATVVVYDPQIDVAVLYSPDLGVPALEFASDSAESESDAIVVGYPLDGPFDPQAARIRDLRDITGPDIYEATTVTREVYTIRALVRSGNSGGPLITLDGMVLGVIFAAAADDPQTGFALTSQEVAATADLGSAATEATGTQECA